MDRYKHHIYKAVRSDPFLSACTTLDHAATRFHACERRAKCPTCIKFDKNGQLTHNIDKLVVSVNMVEVKSAAWEIDKKNFLDRLGKAACGEGDWPYNIVSCLNVHPRLISGHPLCSSQSTPGASSIDKDVSTGVYFAKHNVSASQRSRFLPPPRAVQRLSYGRGARSPCAGARRVVRRQFNVRTLLP